MTLNYDKMTILRIAKYYYLDDLSQQEISIKENIHRSQISRILKLARELGYVQINISVPESCSADLLGKRLENALGLRHALIAPALTPQGRPIRISLFFCGQDIWKKFCLIAKISASGLARHCTILHHS